jgi:hypothetical protein
MMVHSRSVETRGELALRRFKWLLIGVVVTYVAMINLHHNEFWPFSRFPMFARSGTPWTRPLVRELSAEEASQPLAEVWEDQLPGRAFRLHAHHINQDDLGQVLRPMVDGMNQEQADFLARYFSDVRAKRLLVLYAARGSFRPDRSVQVRFRPLARMGPDGVLPLAVDASAERWQW